MFRKVVEVMGAAMGVASGACALTRWLGGRVEWALFAAGVGAVVGLVAGCIRYPSQKSARAEGQN